MRLIDEEYTPWLAVALVPLHTLLKQRRCLLLSRRLHGCLHWVVLVRVSRVQNEMKQLVESFLANRKGLLCLELDKSI